jgi:diguanylate cyclase (GGDEF)-like protein
LERSFPLPTAPQRGGPQPLRRELIGRLLPFWGVTVASLAGLLLPGGGVVLGDLVWVGALLALSLGLMTLPSVIVSLTSPAPFFASMLVYVAFVAALVQAQGGAVQSGSFNLCLLPVLWSAMYLRRRAGFAVVATTVAATISLSLVAHQSAGIIIRKAGLWAMITIGIVLALHHLRDRFATAIAERDATTRQRTALGWALGELTALHHVEGVLHTATRVAAELASPEVVGRRQATYVQVHGAQLRIAAHYDETGRASAGLLLSHPSLQEAVTTLQPVLVSGASPSLDEATEAAQAAGGLGGVWVPVLSRGELHGVLCIVSHRQPLDDGALPVLISVGHMLELALDNARAHEDLVRQAVIDPLTGLHNRRGLASAARTSPGVVVIAADLDGLKAINDTLGHDAGDLAINRFADLLRAAVRPDDTVARIGGDEFVVLLTQSTIEAGRAVAQRIMDALIAEPEPPRLGASLGLAAGRPGELFDVVLRRADRAMYEAKQAGGMRCTEAQKHLTGP